MSGSTCAESLLTSCSRAKVPTVDGVSCASYDLIYKSLTRSQLPDNHPSLLGRNYFLKYIIYYIANNNKLYSILYYIAYTIYYIYYIAYNNYYNKLLSRSLAGVSFVLAKNSKLQ